MKIASLLHKIRIIAHILCLTTIAIGILSFAGWVWDIEVLKSFISNSPDISPIETILFVTAGSAVYIVLDTNYSRNQKFISQILAIIIASIGLLKFLSFWTGIEFNVDKILFSGNLYDEERDELSLMAPNTSFNFFILGLAIFFIDRKVKRNPYEFLCVIITLVSFLSLYGYIYGVNYLYGIASFIPMSIVSTISFLLMSLTILFSRPDRGSLAMVIGENPGEVIFWRFLALFLPLIFGYFQLFGVRNDLFTKEFGTAVSAVMSYAMAMFLIGRKALVQYRFRKLTKRTQRIIKEDAKRLHSILNNSSAVIYIKDLHDRYLVVNKQFRKTYELEGANVIGKTTDEINAIHKGIDLINQDHNVIKNRKGEIAEKNMTINGRKYTYISVRFPLIDSHGKIYAVCCISTDISKQKEYELELVEKEKRLKAIIENIGQGVVVADSNGKFELFNQVAEEILGIGMLEVEPEEWTKRYHVYYPHTKELFPTEKLPLAKALKGESVDDQEMNIENPNFDEIRTISVTGRPIIKEDKSISGVVIFRDISQRKKLQHELMESEERLKTILISIGEGIIVADKEGKFILFNPKAEEILGKEARNTEFSQWPQIFQIFYSDKITHFPWPMLPLARALKGETVENLEIVIKSPEFTEPKFIRISGRPIKDEFGDIVAGVADFKDITEFKRLEEVFIQMKTKYENLIGHKTK